VEYGLDDRPYPGCPEPTWTRPMWSTAYRPKPEGCYYDAEAADKAIAFIRLMRHTKGEYAGRHFDLLPWQEHELVRPMFGWKRPDGLRLYRTIYMETPKKNGKTQIGAGFAGFAAFGDGEVGAEVYTYAADRAQAKIAYDALAYGISYDDSPFEKKGVETLTSVIRNKRTGSFVRVQSSDTKTKHGPNAQCIIFDELHAQPNRELWDVTTSGVAARRQPLVIALTTAGWDRNSICWEQHEHARQVSEGIMDDDTFLGIVYSVPDDADWTSPEVWYQAAPSLGVTVPEDFYVQKCREAQQMPTAQNAFRQLFLSQWTQQAVRAIPLDKWDKCGLTVVKREDFAKQLAYGGLDLAATTDMSAFGLLFPDGEGGYDFIVKYYIPAENIRARELRDRVPYGQWVKDGYIIATPGDVIDYEFIKQDVLDAKKEFDLREISYDPWNAVQLTQELDKERVKMVPMRQGYASMSPPTKELFRLILEGKLRHGGNPVLRWNADSCAAVSDPAGNIKFDKSRSAARIDGMVTLVMALDAVLRNPTAKRRSIYERDDYDPSAMTSEKRKVSA
jgi:phage terminase large subunit-like protein